MTEGTFYLEDLRSKFNKIKDNLDSYYLSYSGGKDSHFLYWFIKEYAPEFSSIEVVGCNTYMEHPEIRRRIYDNADRVLYPALKPQEIKERYGSPCLSKEQDYYIYGWQKARREGREPSRTTQEKIEGTYKTGFNVSKAAREYVQRPDAHKITHLCCYYLKKKPFHDYEKKSGKKAILGVRGAESALRKSKYTSCFSKNGKFTPLHDLPDYLLEAIIQEYTIPVPAIYKYISRTGCMGCPYGSYMGDCERELELLEGAQKKFVIDYFKESYDVLGVDYMKGTLFNLSKNY